jgi:hypothetical protein
METLGIVVGLVTGALLVPAVQSFIAHDAQRDRWLAATPPRARAPQPLRAAAFSCWLVGQLALPLGGALLLALSAGPAGFRRVSASPVTPLDLAWEASLIAWLALSVWCATLVWRVGNALVMGDRALADLRTRRAALAVAAVGAAPIVGLIRDGLMHPTYSFGLVLAVVPSALVLHSFAVRAAFVRHRDAFAA